MAGSGDGRPWSNTTGTRGEALRYVVMDATRPDAYQERPPAPELAGHLACVWSQTLAPDTTSHVHRIVPDGCIDIIWTTAGDIPGGRLHVAGPDTGPVLVTLQPGTSFVGVRFHPGSAPAALGVPAQALRDDRVPLAELWGGESRRLADVPAGSGGSAAAALQRAVAANLRSPVLPEPAAPAIVAALRRGTGVADLARLLGLSERQLHRRCLDAFGYGPKELQRILRFQDALALALPDSGPATTAVASGAEVAAGAGYADQAHLAREVRRLAGVPLGTFVRARSVGL